MRVPFPSAREAEIAFNSLRVDAEPRRGGTKRSLRLETDALLVHWVAKEARSLRVSVNGFLEHLNLVVLTMEQFGPPVEQA
uniref:L antigen family member 3 n=1 Tax=Capitella teleta TaxID=283909 RepID=X1YTL4_CAPTE